MPTISVIIPAYNADLTILKTINSVQQQTFSDFELIVINDGSTDQTLEMLNTVNEPRLRVLSDQNCGVSVARNRGIAESIGEFLSFIDADDSWSPDKLELQLAALQNHPEAGAAYSWTRFVSEYNQSCQDDYPIYFEGDILEPLLLKNFIASGSNIMVRSKAVETIGGFDPDISFAEDWDFYLRLAAICSFVVVPKVQIFYHQATGTASSKIEIIEQSSLRVIEKAFQTVPKRLQVLKQESLARTYQYLAELYLRCGSQKSDIDQAGKQLWKSFQAHPQIALEEKFQNLIKWLIKKWFEVGTRFESLD